MKLLLTILTLLAGCATADPANPMLGPTARTPAKDIARNSQSTKLTGKILDVNPARLIDASGEVDGKRFYDIPKKILDMTQTKTGESKQDIYIFLNGPGGNVFPSVMIVNAIRLAQYRGFKVKCFTSMLAASATFNMLATCSERYALPQAQLLFHPVRIMLGGNPFSGPEVLTAQDTIRLSAELDKIDADEIQFLCDNMVSNQKECNEVKGYYYAEYMWTAAELATFAVPGFLTIVDDITGIPNLFNMGN